MKMTVTTSADSAGLAKIIAQLGTASDLVQSTGFEILAGASELVAVDTGNLKGSLRTEADGPYAVDIGSDVRYSIFQELGTYKMPAHPYLAPATIQQEPIFNQRLREMFTI